MTDRTPGELADALEKAQKEANTHIVPPSIGGVGAAADILNNAITSALTALREMEGTRIEGWVVMEIVEDVEDPDSQHTYYVTTKLHCDGFDRCILILTDSREKKAVQRDAPPIDFTALEHEPGTAGPMVAPREKNDV